MSGPDDSAAAPPPQGCCCACASVLWKIVKVILHAVTLLTVFVPILPGIVQGFCARIALQSVSYAVLDC